MPFSFVCDPEGIQTLDLQNRNLTLYSAKLRDRVRENECKGTKKNEKRKTNEEVFLRMKGF